MQETAKEYEKKLQTLYNDIDKSHVRKIQKKMYDCASKCCDNTTGSYDEVQNCIERCSISLTKVQQYLKMEFESFQTKVQRCLMVCNDNIQGQMEKDNAKTFSSKYKKEYEECGSACLTKHCELLPSIMSKMKTALEENDL